MLGLLPPHVLLTSGGQIAKENLNLARSIYCHRRLVVSRASGELVPKRRHGLRPRPQPYEQAGNNSDEPSGQPNPQIRDPSGNSRSSVPEVMTPVGTTHHVQPALRLARRRKAQDAAVLPLLPERDVTGSVLEVAPQPAPPPLRSGSKSGRPADRVAQPPLAAEKNAESSAPGPPPPPLPPPQQPLHDPHEEASQAGAKRWRPTQRWQPSDTRHPARADRDLDPRQRHHSHQRYPQQWQWQDPPSAHRDPPQQDRQHQQHQRAQPQQHWQQRQDPSASASQPLPPPSSSITRAPHRGLGPDARQPDREPTPQHPQHACGPAHELTLHGHTVTLHPWPSAPPRALKPWPGGDPAAFGAAATGRVLVRLTSPPAQVAAATARSLAGSFRVIQACVAGTASVAAVRAVGKAAAAAAAAASSGVVDVAPETQSVGSSSASHSRDVDADARLGSRRPSHPQQEPRQLWPLLPAELITLASYDEHRAATAAVAAAGPRPALRGALSTGPNRGHEAGAVVVRKSTSTTSRSGSSGGGGGGNASSASTSTSTSSGNTAEQDAAAMAAVTAILEVVSEAILASGVHPLRDVITRLRQTISNTLGAAVGAGPDARAGDAGRTSSTTSSTSAGAYEETAADGDDNLMASAAVHAELGALQRLLSVPHEVFTDVVAQVIRGAPYMSGCQVASVLAAAGALAMPLGPRGGEALARRAVEVLDAGKPPLPPRTGEGDGAAADGDGGVDAELAEWYGADGSDNVRSGFGVGGSGRGGGGADPDAGGDSRGRVGPAELKEDQQQQLRLPPPLAALLMLLLATVLPRDLSRMQVRWIVWAHLRAMLMPPAPSEAMEMVVSEDGKGGAAAVPQQEQLPPVAVAALLVCAKRLQVHISGTVAEAEALGYILRVRPSAALDAADGGAAEPQTDGRVGQGHPETAAGGRLQQQQRDQLEEGFSAGGLSCGLSAQQLRTVLLGLTEEGTMLGSDALHKFVVLLSGSSRRGLLAPHEVVPVVRLFGQQVYELGRGELAGLLYNLFQDIRLHGRAAETSPDAATRLESPSYSRPYLAQTCRELEAVLAEMPAPAWAHSDRLADLRAELLRFAASEGHTPRRLWKAYNAFIRSPSPQLAPLPDAFLDAFIDEARRELLEAGAGTGESVLDRVLATEPDPELEGGVAAAAGGAAAGMAAAGRTPFAVIDVA